MKAIKKLQILAGAILAASMASCSSSTIDEQVEWVPVKNDDGWGFMNPDGEIVLKGEYENRPSCVVNGFFSVEEGEHYALYEFDEKKPKVVKGCDDLASVGTMCEGLIPVAKKGERITVLDDSGEKQFELAPVKGKEITSCAGYYSEGLLWFTTEEDKSGFVDKDGKVVIAAKYDGVMEFHEGKAVVGTKTDDGEWKYSVIDKDGEVLFKVKSGYAPMSGFIEGRMAVRNHENDACGFIDDDGEFTKCPSKVKNIYQFNDDYYVFENEDDKCGVMSFDGEVVLSAKYLDVQIMKNGNFLVRKKDSCAVYDADGEMVADFDDANRAVQVGKFGVIVEGNDDMYSYYETDGEQVKGVEFKNWDLSIRGSVHSDYKKDGADDSFGGYGDDSGYSYPDSEVVPAPAEEAAAPAYDYDYAAPAEEEPAPAAEAAAPAYDYDYEYAK